MCEDNAAYTPTGCILCGENQVPGAAGCVCKAGFTLSEGGCTEAPSALGAACDADPACTDPAFSHCQTSAIGGYCTSTGCSSSAECIGGYACDTSVSPSICRRPPVGLNNTCSSSAECAGTEATYCDAFMAHACLVEGCSVTDDNCFTGYQCCDLSKYGVPQPICVPAGGCQP